MISKKEIKFLYKDFLYNKKEFNKYNEKLYKKINNIINDYINENKEKTLNENNKRIYINNYFNNKYQIELYLYIIKNNIELVKIIKEIGAI